MAPRHLRSEALPLKRREQPRVCHTVTHLTILRLLLGGYSIPDAYIQALGHDTVSGKKGIKPLDSQETCSSCSLVLTLWLSFCSSPSLFLRSPHLPMSLRATSATQAPSSAASKPSTLSLGRANRSWA